MKLRVLVGCPSSFHKEYCIKEYVEGLKNLTYDNFDTLIVVNDKDDAYFNKLKNLGLNVIKGPYFENARDRIVKSRNILKDYAIDNNYDYFFSLEQDVIPPKDIIERMLKHDKKIISGIYFAHNIINNIRTLIPLAYVELSGKYKDLPSMRALNDNELWNDQLLRVVSCGLGCVMIHRDILKEIRFRYEKDKESFDDRFFAIDLFKKKIPIYCDTSIKCKHMIKNRPYPWSRIKK